MKNIKLPVVFQFQTFADQPCGTGKQMFETNHWRANAREQPVCWADPAMG
jgi:hypothetical protein